MRTTNKKGAPNMSPPAMSIVKDQDKTSVHTYSKTTLVSKLVVLLDVILSKIA